MNTELPPGFFILSEMVSTSDGDPTPFYTLLEYTSVLDIVSNLQGILTTAINDSECSFMYRDVVTMLKHLAEMEEWANREYAASKGKEVPAYLNPDSLINKMRRR